MDARAPMFIKIDEYKNVMNLLAVTKEKIAEAKALLAEINDLKREEDTMLSGWSSGLDEVEQHVEKIDAALLEPEL